MNAQVQPVKKSEAPPEIKKLLEDIQETLGVPWPPANWRGYAAYPQVMQLFWERLRPAVAADSFLRDALELTELAYGEVAKWYRPSYHLELLDEDRHRIQWELDAFEYGNPQLLVQQTALDWALAGRTAGCETSPAPRRHASFYRQPEIQMIDEQEASQEVKELYEDMKRALGLPFVNSDYQALAKWPAFLKPAWEDIRPWRLREEYLSVQQELVRLAERAAGRMCPPIQLEVNEIKEAAGSPAAFENLQQTVKVFSGLLPALIINDALFRVGAAGGPVIPPKAT